MTIALLKNYIINTLKNNLNLLNKLIIKMKINEN